MVQGLEVKHAEVVSIYGWYNRTIDWPMLAILSLFGWLIECNNFGKPSPSFGYLVLLLGFLSFDEIASQFESILDPSQGKSLDEQVLYYGNTVHGHYEETSLPPDTEQVE